MSTVEGQSPPSQTCWLESRKEAMLAAYSPFVVSLASGTLEVEAFRHYISQDAYFLKAFARAYEMAEECSDDVDVRTTIAELRMAVLDELELHDSVLREWDVDISKEIIPDPATLKYTRFLSETASGKLGESILMDLANYTNRRKLSAYIIGSMTPCMRLYAFLGKELNMFLDVDNCNHPYKTWIATYASDSFESSALQIEGLLDKLCKLLDAEEEFQLICRLYHQAMKLEVNFFYSQPNSQLVITPFIKYANAVSCYLVIFCDFDLTCTIVDDSNFLAILKSENQLEYPHAKELSAMQVMLGDQLPIQLREYGVLIEEILASGDTKFSYELLQKALVKSSNFEKQTNLRVTGSKVLQGLNRDEVQHAGKRFTFHQECRDFLRTVSERKDDLHVDLHVLSCYWCGDLIRGAFSAGGVDVLNLHLNELQYRGLVSTGEILSKIESPLDKLETFNKVMKGFADKEKRITLYIGDSVSDLLCLLKADIGIVVGSSVNLRRVGAAFGISFIQLADGVMDKQKELVKDGSPFWNGLSGILYSAYSWADVYAFLLGC